MIWRIPLDGSAPKICEEDYWLGHFNASPKHADKPPSGDGQALFYAENWAMVNTLVERCRTSRCITFVKTLESAEQVKALRDVYGLTPVQFEDRILEWIAQGPR